MDRRSFMATAAVGTAATLAPSDLDTQLGVSALKEGADPANKNDSSASINNALKKYRSVFVPDGTYQIGVPINITAGQSLTLAHNAILQRSTKYSKSTEPVVRLLGRRSRFSGGQIVTENAHPQGVVTLGHESDDKSVNYNANDWYFGHTTIRGVNAPGNIGVWIPNSQDARHPDASASNYFGFVEDTTIIGADIGVLLTEVANAHRFFGVLFWNIGGAAWELRGAYGNQIIGGFLHRSKDGVVGIRLKSSRTKNYHPSMQNSFIGFGIEPGGKQSSGYSIESDCKNNTLFVQDNTHKQGQDKNGQNYVMSHGQTLVIPKARIRDLQLGDERVSKSFRGSKNGMTVGGKLIGTDGIGVGNSQKATKPGKIVRKMEVFDAAGRSLGYVAVYDNIR